MVNNLCSNPYCPSHCEVHQVEEFGELVWRYVGGFQGLISKQELLFFNPEKKMNFCQACQGAIDLGEIYHLTNAEDGV